MQEDVVSYRIGGENCIVEADEITIGGKNGKKQTVLVLLEKKPNGKKGRVRFIPITNKKTQTIEKVLIPLIKRGSILHTDGNPTYKLLANRYSNYLTLKAVSHWEENHEHQFLKDINMIIGNFKRWYQGIHHSFKLKNTGLYCNEFSYRFNRPTLRRSETNILFRLINRSITRPQILSCREFFDPKEYTYYDKLVFLLSDKVLFFLFHVKVYWSILSVVRYDLTSRLWGGLKNGGVLFPSALTYQYIHYANYSQPTLKYIMIRSLSGSVFLR